MCNTEKHLVLELLDSVCYFSITTHRLFAATTDIGSNIENFPPYHVIQYVTTICNSVFNIESVTAITLHNTDGTKEVQSHAY